MLEIIGVRFKSGGKQYFFDPQGIQVAEGEGVIVETSRGAEYGQCVQANREVREEAVMQPLRPLIRIATEDDKKIVAKNLEKQEKAFQVCQEKIAAHGLDMKLVDAEYSFEGNKVLFFFTAEGRVDFRALVKDLASAIHARIELRQIGVRDEAKMLGGLGICGRPFCCSQFLDEFQPVSIKMAKTQNLSLNPTKISGTCGRLMCCLKYEQDAYEDLVKHTPKQDSFVETPDGAGTVSSVNLLRQKVHVRLENDPETPQCYHSTELKVIRNGKGKRPDNYVQPPLEELAKLRRVQETNEIPEPTRAPASPLAAALEAVFNGEVPQMDGAATAQEGGEGERRRRRSRSRRGGEKREENFKLERPTLERAAKPERSVSDRVERIKAEKFKPQSKTEKPRNEKPARPPKAERPKPERVRPEGEKAQNPGVNAEGVEKRAVPRRRRKPRGNGGQPQSGGQE